MKIRRRVFLILFGASLLMLVSQAQVMSQPSVWGFVFSMGQGGRPIAGVTVSLVHPTLGRASPSVTDYYGRYSFYNLTPHPQPYYIEAYWGNQLLFRNQFVYQGGTHQYNVPLP